MNFKLKQNNSINITIIVCAVVLMVAIIASATFAWLTDYVERDGSATIGDVRIEIYDGNTKLNSYTEEGGAVVLGTPYHLQFTSEGQIIVPTLSIKNTGTINGIVRCFVSITTTDGISDNHHTDLDGSKYLLDENQLAAVNSDWVTAYDIDLMEGIHSYNMFLNKVLAPNATNVVFDSLEYLGGLFTGNVYIELRADIVAYSGNAYQVDTESNPTDSIDKPFKVGGQDLTPEFLEIWTAWK